MNKTLKYALGAVLTAGIITPALAQNNFPDVPDNHWAYEALARMKQDGLLVGYPDGLFRGNRPASRYELAVAVHAVYMHLKNITDGLQSQIDEIKNRAPINIDDLKAAIAQLQADVNNMKGWGDDIANLKKLADQFQKELASLGVDVEGLKKDLADLAKRVGVLEAHRLPIDIHGDVNLFMMAGGSSSHRPGITVDGRPVGVADTVFAGPTFVPVGMTQDLTMFHELGLHISSNNETGPKWHATMVTGNMLGDASGPGSPGGFFSAGAFPSQSGTSSGAGFHEANESVYFQDLAVDFDTSIIGQGFSAELGRTSYSVDPYIFQRPDVTPYYSNDRWDNGKWMIDGGVLGFHFGNGGVKFDVFAGRNSPQSATNGVILQPMNVGVRVWTPGDPRPVGLTGGGTVTALFPVDQSLGLNLNVPLGTNGKLDLAYIWLESNTGLNAGVTRLANREAVFGGDLKWNFGAITFDGGYSQTNITNGSKNVVNKDNWAWHAGLAYENSKWGATVAYRAIDPFFAAPGDWGRIGLWWNPTDIQGPQASVHINLTDQLKLSASGEWDSGVKNSFASPTGGTFFGMQTNDHVNRYTADLGYRVNDAWNVSFGVEWVDWMLKVSPNTPGIVSGPTIGNPAERWYNIGLGYNLSDMARLNFLWQISDYDAKGQTGFNPFGNALGRATGSLLTTQLTIKF